LLSPERFPREVVEDEKKSLGAYGTASQKQQRPSPMKGLIFQESMFRYFREGLREGKPAFVLNWRGGAGEPRSRWVLVEDCRFFQTIDTASKIDQQNDFTAVLTWALTPWSDLLLYDVWHGKILVPYQFNLFVHLRRNRVAWNEEANQVLDLAPWPRPIMFQAIEDASSGIGLIQQGQAQGVPFKRFPADKDPMVKIAPISTMYNSGQVYHREGAAWKAKFEGEMMAFPNAAHDDMVMAAAQGGYLATHDVILRSGLNRDMVISDRDAVLAAQEMARERDGEDGRSVRVAVPGGGEMRVEYDD
jgi:predicted phage terminase large subunit-like protein